MFVFFFSIYVGSVCRFLFFSIYVGALVRRVSNIYVLAGNMYVFCRIYLCRTFMSEGVDIYVETLCRT
jgi:putative component of membrane protein insertase Oxa1/YidC/SpoIIIJ protein YidD